MAPSQDEKYALLRDGETTDSGGEDPTNHDVDETNFAESPHQRHQARWYSSLHNIGFACSASANFILMFIILIMALRLPGSTMTTEASKPASSTYADLRDDPAVQFPYSVGYGPEITNHSLADERWEAIDINSGIVAIPVEWAETHNLPSSQPFPWDPSKSVYTLTAFHTLHCLKNIHRLLYDAHHGRPLSRDVGHALHCLDHMRKDAMCKADDFLLPTPPDHYNMAGPRGQSRVCRDWDQLLRWADDHHACYQHMDDDEERFAKEHKEIERYHNCPPGSPYEAKMKAYFETP